MCETACVARFRFALPIIAASSCLAQTGVLNLSRDLFNKGIAATNLAPNTPTLDARPLVEAAVAWAANNRISTIVADTGSYYFLTQHSPNQHVLVPAANYLTIDFQNSNLYFAKSNTAAIECQSCVGVTFQNFTVDYQQLPFTQATITAVDAASGKLTYQALPGWQSPADFGATRAPDGSDVIRMFVFRNGAPLSQVGRLVAARPGSGSTITVTNTTDPWASAASLAAIQAGDTLVFTDCGGPAAINVTSGQRVYIKNVSVYAAGGTAVQFARTSGVIADHLQVIPRPGTSRLISANGRGIVSTYALAGNSLTNNTVRRTCDDAVSLTTAWIATTVQVAGTNITVNRRADSPIANASISFINPSDASVVTSANVVSQNPLPASQTYTDGETITLTLDKAVSGVAAGMGVVDNDSAKRGNGSSVSGNLAQQIVFGSGVVLAGVQNVQVHDNLVQQTANAGILVRQ